MMRNKSDVISTLLAVVMAITLVSCDLNNEPGNNPVIFYSDIVSGYMQPDSTIYLEQILQNDQGSVMLYPSPAIKGNIQNGQRLFIQYSVNEVLPDSNMNVTLYNVTSIRCDTIVSATPDSIAAFPNDPLMINTLWRTGSYLNIDLSIEYYNKQHKMELYYSPTQVSADTLDILLRHSNNGDMMGYWTQTYSSFYIPNINTYKVVRLHANMENEPKGYIETTIH